MLLTEYDETKTLKAEFYAGKRAEQREALLRLMQHVADRNLSVSAAVVVAADYGVTDEADFRKRAVEQGIQLPE